jgi:hypothetical protein
MLVVRRYVIPRLRVKESDSEFVGAMVQSVMVFYGLALALIAVSVWQTYNDVSKTVSQEATAYGALYRDVSGYPEPIRSRLQEEVRGYIDYHIHEGVALQREGIVPRGGVDRMNRFQAILTAFEPKNESQKVLHAETLAAYNRAMLARRLRLDAVNTGLPGVMWAVILVGAFISVCASLLFRVEGAWLHGILVVLLAALIGMVIFMTVALNHPFRGDLGIGAEPYQLIYDQLMKPKDD